MNKNIVAVGVCFVMVSSLFFAIGFGASENANSSKICEENSGKFFSTDVVLPTVANLRTAEQGLLQAAQKVSLANVARYNIKVDGIQVLDPPFEPNVNINPSPTKDSYPTILHDSGSNNCWVIYQHENTSATENDIHIGASTTGGTSWNVISLGNLLFTNQTGGRWWANNTVQPSADIDAGKMWFTFADTALHDWLFLGRLDAATGQMESLGGVILELRSNANPNWQWRLTNVRQPSIAVAGNHLWILFVADVTNTSAGTTWTGPITNAWAVGVYDVAGDRWRGFGLPTPSAPTLYDFTLSNPACDIAISTTQENMYYSYQGRGDVIVQGGSAAYQAIFYGWWDFLVRTSGDELVMGGQNFNVVNPAIAASQDYGYVVVQTDSSRNDDIGVAYTTRGGNSVQADWRTANVVTTTNPERYPAVSANPNAGNNVAVVYFSQFSLHYKGSADNGATWSAPLKINDNTPGTVVEEYHTASVFAIRTSQPFVVWGDIRTGNGDIYFSTLPMGDATPPGQVTDLTVTATTTNSATLQWTAVADNGTDPASGRAAEYDIRYTTVAPIDTSNWDSITQATGEPTPGLPGSTETFQLTGITAQAQTHFIALKVGDEVPNWSPISNCVATTGVIVGTVTDASNGNPIVDAAITVYEAGTTNRVGSAFSGTDGKYVVTNLAAGTFDVKAEKTGYDAVTRTGISAGPGPLTKVDFQLIPTGQAGTIQGTVTDATTGNRLEGVTITVYAAGTTDVRGTATTASDGTYSVRVAAGTYDVKAEKRGYDTETQTGKTVAAGGTITVDFRLRPIAERGRITGTVRDANTNAAIDGVSITVYTAGTPNQVGTATTGADGKYVVPDLLPGSYDVEATKMGYATDRKTSQTVTAGQDTVVDFALAPQEGTITGTVRDADTNNLLSGVTIKVYEAGTTTLKGSTTTDSNGAYSVTVAPGTYDVEASKPGYSTATERSKTVTAGGTVVVDFRLTAQTGTIRGTVTDATTNNPLEGATITVYETGTTNQKGSATTAADGTYSVSVPSGTYDVEARKTDYNTVIQPRKTVDVGATITVDFQLTPIAQTGTIEGTVTDASTNALLEGVTITVYEVDTNNVKNAATTDTSGSYSVAVLAGTYDVAASKTGYVTLKQTGVSVSAGATITVNFQLIPAGQAGTIKGAVTDATTNSPLEGVTITVYEAGTNNVRSTATTGTAGTYSIAVLAGTYDVEASKTGYSTAKQTGKTVDAGGTITVDFSLTPITVEKELKIDAPSSVESGKTFTVTIKDKDGKAVGGAKVTFADEEEITAQDGTVEFTAPDVTEDTTYRINASKTGYKSASKVIKVTPKTVRAEGDNLLLYAGVGGGVAAAVIILLVALLLMRRKKKAAAAAAAPPPTMPPPGAPPPAYPYPPPGAPPPAYPYPPPGAPPPEAPAAAPTQMPPPPPPQGPVCSRCGKIGQPWETNCSWCGTPLQ